jgi:hypothetical protein
MDYTALIEEWEDHLPTEQLSGGLRATAAAALCQTSAPDPRQDGLSWGPWRYDAQRLGNVPNLLILEGKAVIVS